MARLDPVRDNERESRYELTYKECTAFSEYQLRGQTITFTHSEVPAEIQGHGVGSALARGALDSARSRGLRVVPLCPFIAGFIMSHPEYLDLVDPETRQRMHPGSDAQQAALHSIQPQPDSNRTITPVRGSRLSLLLSAQQRWGARVKLMMTAAGGLIVGVATSYLQGILPGASNTLANSGAVWSVAGFLIVIATGCRGGIAIVAGALALLGEIAGYYAIASPLRGFPSAMSERVLWTAAAVVVGPVVGLAATWLMSHDSWRQVAAIAVMCGIVAGEGLHGIFRIRSDGLQWWTEIVVALTVGAAALLHVGRSSLQRVAGAAGIVLVAVTIWFVYGVPG